MALFVEIAKSEPQTLCAKSKFSDVTCTTQVRAQLMQTISMLLTNFRHPTSLFFLLSNNYVNQLVLSLKPLNRFTYEALEEIMPVYISLLKTLALQLASFPPLFHLFFYNKRFAIFSAAVEVATSSYANLDSFVHLTSLNIILNLCEIKANVVRYTISQRTLEQRRLITHLCTQLLMRYSRFMHLTRCKGEKVDELLSCAISELQEQTSFVSDLLRCGVTSINVRLCEYLLRQALYPHFLENLRRLYDKGANIPYEFCSTTESGENCNIVKVDYEVRVNVTLFILSQLFFSVEYVPLLRMIAVALLHRYSPNAATNSKSECNNKKGDEYLITIALHDIVQSHLDFDEKDSITLNPYREALLKLLRGESGVKGFLAASSFLQCFLNSDAADSSMLQTLEIIPTTLLHFNDESFLVYEDSLSYFFQNHVTFPLSSLAIESGCALSLILISVILSSMKLTKEEVEKYINSSTLLYTLKECKQRFAESCYNYHTDSSTNVSSVLFMDLVELEISERLCLNDKPCSYSLFRSHPKALLRNDPKSLFNFSVPVENLDAVDEARFIIRTFIHLHAISNVIQDMLEHKLLQHDLNINNPKYPWRLEQDKDDPNLFYSCLYSTIHQPDEELLAFAGVKTLDSLTIKDLRGRTFFRFCKHRIQDYDANYDHFIQHNHNKEWIIIIDPTEILIAISDRNVGDRSSCLKAKVYWNVPLVKIIATAIDGPWIHIALRQVEDFGWIVKNGNLALRFEATGVCSAVCQHIDQCRTSLKLKLSQRMHSILHKSIITNNYHHPDPISLKSTPKQEIDPEFDLNPMNLKESYQNLKSVTIASNQAHENNIITPNDPKYTIGEIEEKKNNIITPNDPKYTIGEIEEKKNEELEITRKNLMEEKENTEADKEFN